MARRQSTEERRLYRRKKKADLVAYKGGECERCGQVYLPDVYDFHHRDPTTKKFTLDVSRMSAVRWSAIIEEADKCHLLCANCHREIHALKEEEYFGKQNDTNSRHRDRRIHSKQMSLPLDIEPSSSD